MIKFKKKQRLINNNNNKNNYDYALWGVYGIYTYDFYTKLRRYITFSFFAF